MSIDFSAFDIRSLANLLSQHNDNSDSDNETESQPGGSSLSSTQGPGDIGVLPKQNERKTESKEKESSHESLSTFNAKDSSTKNIQKNSIWTAEEVSKEGDKDDGVNLSLIGDPRVNPQYEMHYRQSVTAEDVFLQMGGKTPGTASCEELIVEIHLPDEDYHKVELNLKKQIIDLSSPIYFLHLGLPHPIDPRAGNAKWDQNKEKLTIALKLAREFDDLNF